MFTIHIARTIGMAIAGTMVSIIIIIHAIGEVIRIIAIIDAGDATGIAGTISMITVTVSAIETITAPTIAGAMVIATIAGVGRVLAPAGTERNWSERF